MNYPDPDYNSIPTDIIPRFRKIKKQVKNRILYAILLSRDIKISQLASAIGVSTRNINLWIVKGSIPNKRNLELICSYLGYPKSILFNQEILNSSPIICLPALSPFYKRKTPTKNEILHGLMILYNTSYTGISVATGFDTRTLRRYVQKDFLPPKEHQIRLSVFFRIPHTLLFYNVLRVL